MKKFSLILLLFFVIYLGYSQSKTTKKEEKQADFFIGLNMDNLNYFGGTAALHYTFNKYFSAGAGVDMLNRNGGKPYFYPIYLDTRFYFSRSKFSPFIFVQGGGVNFNAPNEEGKTYMGGGAGVAVNPGKWEIQPYISLSYRRFKTVSDLNNVKTENFYNSTTLTFGFHL